MSIMHLADAKTIRFATARRSRITTSLRQKHTQAYEVVSQIFGLSQTSRQGTCKKLSSPVLFIYILST